jgi:hypothetical protein
MKQNKPRSSLLCLIGIDGLLDTFSTEGTFDRLKFIGCCKEFALKNPQVRQYPGANSVWILDGAAIHCDPNIVYYLRSLGIHLFNCRDNSDIPASILPFL